MTISLTIIAILAAAVLVAIYGLVAWAWRTAHPADGRIHRSLRERFHRTRRSSQARTDA